MATVPSAQCTWPLSRSGIDSETPPVGNVHHPDLGHGAQQFHPDVAHGRDAAAAVAHLAPLGARHLDQVTQGLRPRVGCHDDDQRRRADLRDGAQVLQVVVGQFLARSGRDAHAGRCNEQGVAIGCRPADEVRAHGHARTRLVLDHEALPDPRPELVAHHARHHIGAAPGRCGVDDPDRPRRPRGLGLRSHRQPQRGQRRGGSAAAQQGRRAPGRCHGNGSFDADRERKGRSAGIMRRR